MIEPKPGADRATPIATLRQIAVKAQRACHKSVDDTCHLARTIGTRWTAGEGKTGQRRRNHREGIRNVTANPTRKFNETVGIGYGDDIDKAKEIALEVLGKIENIHGDPGPEVYVTGLGDSAVNLSLRGWVDTSKYFGTCCEVRHRIKVAYDEAGISIPYPQQDVHMHNVEG